MSSVTRVPSQLARAHRTDLGEVTRGVSDRRQRSPASRLLSQRKARLRQRPGRQHRPAVARARYSPKGLIGRVPVFTSRLRLEIELECLDPELPAEARLLVAAERDAREGGVRQVDPDGAGLDPAREPVPPPGLRSRPTPSART